MDQVYGKVTIAPSVLTTIVRQTALDQRGVRRLAPTAPTVRSLSPGAAVAEGIFVAMTEQGVEVELHVVAQPEVSMLKLGTALQTSITRALEEMVGMPVSKVDVFIDDVTMPGKAG